ncbi:hypothetical protein DLH72_01605 [Candidatus Gracilibacteria bacterium]|nr:MAG: hypothetical protein DLH72_01605 [Candidatus Gracilibacteria bacterium]
MSIEFEVIKGFIFSLTIIMKIYLIRHSETIESSENIILGQLPGNLSEKGIFESKKIGKFLKEKQDIFKIEKIFSSDLKRAKDTAEIINNFLDLEIKFLKILRERKAGIVEGKNENEINWENYEKIFLPYRKHKGGENFLEVRKRAKGFYKNFFSEKENILVVSHSVFILMFLSFFKKKSIKDSLKIDIKNKIICVDLGNKRIEFINL